CERWSGNRSPRCPVQAERHRKETPMKRILGRLALAAATTSVGVALAAGPASATGEPPLTADMIGSFFFHACPPGAPDQALCLRDDVGGTMTPLGQAAGSFEVVFDVAQFVDGCGPIIKSGSFLAADGAEVRMSAQGNFCFTTLIAEYQYTIEGGTGRFADASGSGTWIVPPPSTFAGGARG